MLSEAAQRDGAMLGQVVYERRDADFYATPPENVDCLAHFIDLSKRTVWEPACGEGHISKRLSQIGAKVYSTDLHDRGFGRGGIDFLKASRLPGTGCEAVITNPPFGDLAEEFLRRAIQLTQPVDGLVAMFLRNEYDCASTGRSELFQGHPAYSRKVVVTKRPRWIEGSTGSPRHNYAWYVWDWSRTDNFQAVRAALGFSRPHEPIINYIHPKNARPLKSETVQ